MGQTITNVLYAMQHFSDKEREGIEKGEESDEESCQRKASKLNGDVKSLKNELELRDYSESSFMKCPVEHNGLPKGIFSFIYMFFRIFEYSNS